jgi:hypothetical protein
MTLFEFATEAMDFVEDNWVYYDHDWGRARCRFCGHSGMSSSIIRRDEITHADDCRYINMKTDWMRLQQENTIEE